ncbi:MAG: hypothetical protein J5802_10280 [Butyrivibrio sp.]|nr:hypothetical protein [Butyrivibrio sp.]
METIRNYLESMFANLPNTPDVMRAKNELLSMMEDKFTELINEGKPQNEAVGIIISEFGNLQELAETLGIQKELGGAAEVERRLITNDEAMEYVYEASQSRYLIGIGVMLFIFSPIPLFFHEIGIVLFFLLISAGVGVIIWSSIRMSQWKFLDTTLCCIDYATADYLSDVKKNNTMSKALMLTIGVMFCIMSVVPILLFDALLVKEYTFVMVGPAMLFVFVGIGVLLIIASGAKDAAYTKLLSLNGVETVAGNYESVRSTREPYAEKKAAAGVMSVYWRTVSCIYLIWSFISFDWHITWLIWPVAAILHGILKSVFNGK